MVHVQQGRRSTGQQHWLQHISLCIASNLIFMHSLVFDTATTADTAMCMSSDVKIATPESSAETSAVAQLNVFHDFCCFL